MRIGHFVSVVAGQLGFERNVSGHVQIPLHGMQLQCDAGHEVHLITNQFGEDRSLPSCLPQAATVHLVTDARKRGGVMTRTGKQQGGLGIRNLVRQVAQIKAICKELQFDVLHLHGYNRTAHLAGGLRWAGLDVPTVVTIFGAVFPERGAMTTGRLWRSAGTVVTATQHVQDQLASGGIDATILRHGIVRDFRAEHADAALAAPHRVLFWRDPTIRNGADVAVAAFDRLAPLFPDVSFDLAVRPHWDPIDVDEVANAHPNVHVHRFPYAEGVTLSGLLLESICVVMPIRHMSIDPQLVIAETLAAGVPIITTNQRSNPEIVKDGQSGILVPLGDVDATTSALKSMLEDREATAAMGVAAAKDVAAQWNWDSYVADLEAIYARVER